MIIHDEFSWRYFRAETELSIGIVVNTILRNEARCAAHFANHDTSCAIAGGPAKVEITTVDGIEPKISGCLGRGSRPCIDGE